MRRIIRDFSGVLIFFIVFFIAFALFALYTATRTDVRLGEEYESDLIHEEISVYRDRFNIPHIISEHDDDVYFAVGYLHAQDRLWQMDIARRAGRGRLSEIFGKDALQTDKFMRCIDLKTTAKIVWQNSSKKTKKILTAYTNGVNSYISSRRGAFPFEFGALSYIPEQWTETDCLVVGKLMAFEMSMSFWADIAFGELAETIGREKAEELLPNYPESAPTIVASPQKTMVKKNNSSAPNNYKSEMFSDMSDILISVRNYLGFHGSGVGSNCWVMRKSLSPNSKPIMANDPHLTLSLPARWYPLHISSPKLNIVGMTIPGIPVCISGRNDKIAWGIVNMMADDCDYFFEKTDPSNDNYYFSYTGARKKFRYRRDTIHIKGDELHIYDIRFTDRSAVISDAHLFRDSKLLLSLPNSKQKPYFLGSQCLTFQWTAHTPADEMLSLDRIGSASSWKEFLSALNSWGAPALNFVYADVQGNIGVAPSGMLPLRGDNASPVFPLRSWVVEDRWKGVARAGSFLREYNPSRRFIACANNKVASNFPSNAGWWEPPSRIQRLTQSLSEYDDYDVRDAQFLQMDNMSVFAAEIMKISAPILKNKRKYLFPEADTALTLMENWDGMISIGKMQPALFALFLDELQRMTWIDDLGERLFRQYTLIANIPTRKISELMVQKKSMWFDNRTTPQYEDRDEIVFRAFSRAVRRAMELSKDKSSFRKLRYGDIHQLTLKHIFSANPLLDNIVTQGPFETGGSNTTLNNGEWKVFAPFSQTLGASMRLISDLEDSVVYAVVPGGVSGEPLSAHYSDQVQLWLKGGYVKISMKKSPSIGSDLYLRFRKQE